MYFTENHMSTELHSPTETSNEDYVNHPKHYERNGKECIDEIKDLLTPEEYRGYLKGTSIKYIWRYPYKWNPAQDLEKSLWYVNRLMTDCKQCRTLPSWDDRIAYIPPGNDTPEAHINSFIECGVKAIGYDQYTLARRRIELMQHELYLIDRMKEDSKMSEMNDDISEMNDSIEKDDISDRMTVEDLKASIDTIFGANKKPSKEPCRPHNIAYSNEILRGMKYLAVNYPNLWRNAYWFNFDEITHVLHIKSVTSAPCDDDNRDNCFDVYLTGINSDTWEMRVVDTLEYMGKADTID